MPEMCPGGVQVPGKSRSWHMNRSEASHNFRPRKLRNSQSSRSLNLSDLLAWRRIKTMLGGNDSRLCRGRVRSCSPARVGAAAVVVLWWEYWALCMWRDFGKKCEVCTARCLSSKCLGKEKASSTLEFQYLRRNKQRRVRRWHRMKQGRQ